MTGRIARIIKRTGPNPLFARGGKPRILPMSKEDERLLAELHRRREAKRQQQAAQGGASGANPRDEP